MREIAQKLSRCSSFGALMDDAFARCPEREAIVYEDWRLTYGDLERYIHQTAHYLRHLGVRKGSRVAILSRNCPEWIIAEFALYQLGAIVVKTNGRLTPPEQARMLARNQVSVAFLTAANPQRAAATSRMPPTRGGTWGGSSVASSSAERRVAATESPAVAKVTAIV